MGSSNSSTMDNSASSLPAASPSTNGTYSNSFKSITSAGQNSSDVKQSRWSFANHSKAKLNRSRSHSVLTPLSTPNSSISSSKHASDKIVRIAADFWNSKISSLPFEQQVEIGVAMYLDMFVNDSSMKAIFKKNFNHSVKIQTLALKFFNMMGWLIRTLSRSDINMEATLQKLGIMHRAMGIKTEHFKAMLDSLHSTFAYYFPHQYGIKEKYAVDYMFILARKLMMAETMEACQSDHDSTEYLESLQKCLRSEVGREYMFRYLQQTWCDEIVIYLENIQKFEQQTSNKGRFMIARNIVDVSINAQSDMAVNISYECRMNVLYLMHEYQQQFCLKENIEIDSGLFSSVTKEIHGLIRTNHWRTFKSSIKNMKL